MLEQNKNKVVVAMSGGVDSSVAAYLLKEQGYDVIGITMQLWDQSSSDDSKRKSCCSLSDVNDARRFAHKLGIPHYIVNYENEFKNKVVDYFAMEYASGRTPNPCVMCNSHLKFDHLMHRAQALGAYYVATGHYAQIEHRANGTSLISKAVDSTKDQTYFLFAMQQRWLERILFPLGSLSKDKVRKIASKLDIKTAQKKESQEICFVSSKRYTDFLKNNYAKKVEKKGDIVDANGVKLGEHEGVYAFTVGQRKGLRHLKEIYYVKEINAQTSQIIVDKLETLKVNEFIINKPQRLFAGSNSKNNQGFASFNDEDLHVVVRYHAQAVQCKIVDEDKFSVKVKLKESLPWISPGQAGVFYNGSTLLGGGFIAKNKD